MGAEMSDSVILYNTIKYFWIYYHSYLARETPLQPAFWGQGTSSRCQGAFWGSSRNYWMA